jgi:HD-like signal output (HDOD) protein
MSNKLEAILQTASLMPAIPRAVQEVLKLLQKDETTVGELSDAVSLDPVIAAKVLRMANSAFFGRSKQVDNIEDAAYLIGIDSIRTMVLASGMMGSIDNTKNFDMNRFWRLSLLSAYIARDLAKFYGHDGNRAYTAALIHGLGVLAIHKAVPDVAAEIDSTCADNCAYDRADAENKALGFDHAEVSAAIASFWNLPKQIGESIRHYPHPALHNAPEDMSGLLHLSVALAIDIADNIPYEKWYSTLDAPVQNLLDPTLTRLPELQPRFDKAKQFVDMMVNIH